jgi:hypothetical protein
MTMVSVFFSYSHSDEGSRNELEKHLAMLKRQGLIAAWHDRRILAGEKLDQEIDQSLIEADLVLLLVSPDFLASEYCYSREMNKALEMRGQGRAWVIPIILEHCDWRQSPLGELLACPKDGKPVADYPNPNKAFNEITQEIRRVVEGIESKRSRTATAEPASAPSDSPADSAPIIVDKPRSGNLRIKKEFSDYEKDTFRAGAFEYIATFFRNSLRELKERNPKIDFTIRGEQKEFTVVLYRSGSQIAACQIANRNGGYSLEGISYSYGLEGNGMNALLSVEDDGYNLFLTPTFGMMGGDEKFSYAGAAEHYWRMFIEPLQ